MNNINNERGATLLLVLLMVLVFTVLGMSLISTSLSGTKRTIILENQTQAIAIAEKGVEHVEKYINLEIENLKNEDGKIELFDPLNPERSTAELFYEELNAIVNNFSLYNQDYEIENLEIIPISSSDPDEIDFEITFTSVGKINNSQKKIDITLAVNAGGVFELLSFAAGSEGNIFLHGASTIEGDLYVGKNLYAYDRAHVYSGRDYYIPSLYPCLKSDYVYITGNIFKINQPSISNYSSHLAGNITYPTVSNLSEVTAFGCSEPILVPQETEFKPIDIYGNKSRFVNQPINRETLINRVCTSSFWGICTQYSFFYPTMNNANLFDKPRFSHNNSAPLTINNNVTLGGLKIENKDVEMRNSSNQVLNISLGKGESDNFIGGMYIDGDLSIGNTSSMSNTVSSYEKFRINGPIFVDGDLIIRGTDIEFNSTIYVTGTTDIQYSRLRGIQQATSESSLVLFGNGPVKISNISAFENDRNQISKVRGFFYSNRMLEMYGVGSNIQIEGGIFGQNIVLNAIRGNSYSSSRSGFYNVGGWWFEPFTSQLLLSPDASRLIIKHNPDLVENPPDALPAVEDIEMRRIERSVH